MFNDGNQHVVATQHVDVEGPHPMGPDYRETEDGAHPFRGIHYLAQSCNVDVAKRVVGF